MKWYIQRLEEHKKAVPVYSVCGDDCAVCPRYLASTEAELRETAEFWFRAGWRDRVVSSEEIRCAGCSTRPTCSYRLLPCVQAHGVSACNQCGEYACGKIQAMLENSEQKKASCRAACETEEEFSLLCRAFYEKEKNLARKE